MPRLTFLGAARTVTGSKYLLEANGDRILVDCGLFQGLKELRQRNWEPLPVDAASIDVVVLTHAHLDHVGYLPRLVAGGFKGRVFCTAGSADLAKVVLPDAGRLQEEDARQANKHGYSKHDPALPLFTETDAYRALTHLQPVGYDRSMPVTAGVTAEFVNAGHLLGSSIVRMRVAANGSEPLTLVFGGDLGRYDRPVLPDPSPVTEADILLAESTYGNRIHEPDDDGEALAEIIRTTIDRGGRVIVPAFAIGRVEEVLYWIRRLEEERRIPIVPVFLDSPMASEALRFYAARYHELDPDIRPGRHDVSAFATARFTQVSSPQQSKEVMRARKPAVIISSSGMATGGRVLHHLKEGLPDSRVTVLFVGYQAAGTRGRAMLEGADTVKIHGQLVPVNARVAKLDSMSAHADQQEMLRWLGSFTSPPRTTYLVHGEPEPMDALGAEIRTRLGWEVQTPEYLDAVEF
ncbi:MAG: MBL fold metallo-hydrolase [Vicinamibacteraceae bacterium]|nr:MBL fold metallo-hydrolase [Vicinamibacteraceae bacterium]